jgi:hypothetical protein
VNTISVALGKNYQREVFHRLQLNKYRMEALYGGVIEG